MLCITYSYFFCQKYVQHPKLRKILQILFLDINNILVSLFNFPIRVDYALNVAWIRMAEYTMSAIT